MSTSPVLARRQIRLAAVQALAVLVTDGSVKLLDSPGAWTSQPEKTPAVLVRAAQTSKESMSKGSSNFVSTVSLEIETRLTASSSQEAQDAIEQLDALVEQALLTSTGFISLSQHISIQTNTQVTAEARNHIGATEMVVRCELPEEFDPIYDAPTALQPVAVPLEQVGIHNDMAGTFDASGTYDQGLFPDAVMSAPRTSGPDGRDEGALDLQLPQ